MFDDSELKVFKWFGIGLLMSLFLPFLFISLNNLSDKLFLSVCLERHSFQECMQALDKVN